MSVAIWQSMPETWLFCRVSPGSRRLIGTPAINGLSGSWPFS